MLFWKLQRTLEDDTLCPTNMEVENGNFGNSPFLPGPIFTAGSVGERDVSFRQIVSMNFSASVLKQPRQRQHVFWETPSDGL